MIAERRRGVSGHAKLVLSGARLRLAKFVVHSWTFKRNELMTPFVDHKLADHATKALVVEQPENLFGSDKYG